MTKATEFPLAGKRILITGASSGIGRATAHMLASQQVQVFASGRSEEKLAELETSLPGEGHKFFAAPLTDADQTAAWLKSIAEENGPLHGIFHAAGIELLRPARLTKQSHIDEVFSSSLHAAFGIARASNQQGVMEDGGSVLLMSSVAGSSGQVGMTTYSAAKAGIEGLTRSLACELAARRIRANAIAAGAVETPMHGRIVKGTNDAALDAYRNSHLLGFGTPDDVAHAASFLLSPNSKWITGTTLIVDGGYLCR